MALSLAALEALTRFRADLGAVQKNSTAKAGSFSYDYVEINALLEAIEPLLAQHNFTITQVLGSVDGKPALCTTLWHDADGEVSFDGDSVPLVFAPNDPQQFGAAVTYFRRYAIITILGLRTEDNDAAPKATTSGPAPSARTQSSSAGSTSGNSRSQAPASSQQRGGKNPPNFQGMLYYRAKEAGFDSNELAARFFNINSSKSLTDDQAKHILDWLKNGAVDEAAAVVQQGFGTSDEPF